MSDAGFESHKRSVIIKRLEKLKNMDQETGRHCMIEFYSTYIKPTSPARSKLVVQLIEQSVSSKAKEAEESSNGDTTAIYSNGVEPVLIRDVREYKARLPVTAGARQIRDLGKFEEIN
ncbi:hypothetical protein F5Y06DRAFT_305417 [Hypoxylon sp. FL0890]|nr:hypothetical protein F5Y06DRAFT_305417 [Hypoxylon sp. FL0890]